MIGNGLALFTSLMLSLIITISRKARTGMGFAPLFAALVPCLVGLYMIGGPSCCRSRAGWRSTGWW